MAYFKTSIRVPKGTTFGAVVNRGIVYVSLDGLFTKGTIVLKMTVEDWDRLVDTVYTRIGEGEKR